MEATAISFEDAVKKAYYQTYNKTPAEVSGIKIEGENKWLTLIQNASNKNQ